MAVTAWDSDYSSKRIQISPTSLIKQVLHLPFNNVQLQKKIESVLSDPTELKKFANQNQIFCYGLNSNNSGCISDSQAELNWSKANCNIWEFQIPTRNSKLGDYESKITNRNSKSPLAYRSIAIAKTKHIQHIYIKSREKKKKKDYKRTYRLLVVVEKRRSEKLLPFLKNFIGGWTIIRTRLVIERRNLRRSISKRRRSGVISAEERNRTAMIDTGSSIDGSLE